MNFLGRSCVLCALSLLAYSIPATAYLDNFEFFTPSTVYPPGCAVFIVPIGEFHAHAKTEIVFSGTMRLWDTSQTTQFDVEIEIKRVGCTEPNRSTILVFLTVPSNDDEVASLVSVPIATGWVDGTDGFYPLRLAREPHSYQTIHEVLREGETTGFFLDGAGWEWVGWCWDCWMSPGQYNGEFTLEFDDRADGFGGETVLTTVMPAYENQLQEDFMPWNARLSGVWVIPEARDQGFVVSVSEIQSPYAGPLVIFLSWNTFDKDGNPLWLTGTTSFPISSTEVTTELILVQDGQFLGSKAAGRSSVGNIQLQARSCTRIQVYYDLEALGLGSGEFTLTRLFNLEPAGFACQDGETRQL